MSNQAQETDSGVVSDASYSFDSFDLHPEVTQAIKEMGFDKPTPVQALTFAKIMEGTDIVAKAQTGTGKTAAFGIPLVEKLRSEGSGVAALALVPTRELAQQVSKELSAIGKKCKIKCASVYGGVSFTKQVKEVSDGARIVVGTPGRVLDHIRSGSISFDELQTLVLDEADEMLSMGFEKEISEIIDALPKKRQNLLFSATIPDDISRLTKRYMADPIVISISGDEISAKEISHFVYLVSGQGRQKDMVRVLEVERPDSAIIFCNTKDGTQLLAKHLKNAGYKADWLNSDLSQNERETVMKRIRSGEIEFLVATDVAARGIDVSHLSHVINYTFPDSLEVYIHRTGRTGRMGRQGTAISLITPQNIGNLYYLRLSYKIYPIEKSLANEKTQALFLEFNRIALLRKAFVKKQKDEFLSLARRVLQDVHAERIISGLLEKNFEQQTETEAKELPLKPAPTEETIEEITDDKDDKQEAIEPPMSEAPAFADSEEPDQSAEESAGPLEAEYQEIFVDAGRKDGLRISYLMKEIIRITKLDRSDLGKVRMLTRSAFVSVAKEHFDDVLKAIGKIEVEGRRLKAEPAEES